MLLTGFLLGLLLSACSGHEDRFYFSINPKPESSVVSGQPVTLHCRTSASAGLAYYWQLNSKPLANTTRRYQHNSDLVITRVDRERDAGEFTCIATNLTSSFSLTSQAATLNVQWISEETSVQLQENANAGGDVILRCSSDGSGDLKHEWFRNGRKISRNNERNVMKGKKLHIRSATPEDNGLYKCVTRNEAGSVVSNSNYPLAISGDGYPQGVLFPSNQMTKQGDSVKFDCTFDGAEQTLWFFGKNDVPLAASQKYAVHENGSLVVHEISEGDAGFYHCVGVAEKNVTYSAELQLSYLEAFSESSLEPKQPNSMSVVAVKSEFQITCLPPKGIPRPTVWWRAPNGRVVSDSGPVRVDESRLIIDSAAIDNVGNYTCEAENLAGSHSLSLQLFVTTKPIIVQDPMTITVDEGAHASLHCLFKAAKYPITHVRWRKDSGSGVFKYLPDEFVGKQNNGTLLISAVQVLDKGAYQCEISTTGFKPVYSKKAHIYVNEKLKFNPTPVNKKFELGLSAKLYCKAQGSDKPVVKWLKENTRMFKLPEHVQDINGTLHFSKVLRSDKGKYTCLATNSQGIINVTIEIDVIVSPKFIVAPQNPTEALEGSSVVIHCVVEGDPKPTVQWDRNSKINDFDDKRYTVLENGSLVINEVTAADEAKYGCTAGNSGGFRREELQLIVRNRDYLLNGGADSIGGEEGAVMTRTVAITLSAATAYMLLVIGLMVWCRYRRSKRKQQSPAAPGETLLKPDSEGANGEITELRENLPKIEGGGEGSSAGNGAHKKSRASYDKLSFPRQDLNKILTLGHGEFGEVFVAKAKGMKGSTSEEEGVVVMAKALESKEDDARQEFKRQLDVTFKLRHKHVVRLLGLCRESEPHCLIMEYTDWGDLKQMLQATTAAASDSRKDLPPPLTMSQLVQLSVQVIQGMEHLANHRLVHKDLAARNILITSGLSVKISWIGLSKDKYSHEYFKHNESLKPIRWMPSEAVFEDDFSTKSDVWSFGVLFWEMLHAGETPLSKLTDEAVLSQLSKKELQWRPPRAAPDNLQPILKSCWSDCPKDRPSFSELRQTFETLCQDSHI